MIKAVIFDLDGTLVDAYQTIADTMNYVLKELGLPQQDCETVRRRVGRGIRVLVSSFVPQGQVERAVDLYMKKHEEILLDKTTLMPGAKDTLESLKAKGIRMGLVSNKDGRFVRRITKHLGIDDFFEGVICSDEAGKMKPDPACLNILMAKFGVTPDQTLYVGDSTIDILTGKNAGVRVIAIPTGSDTKSDLIASGPHRIINKLPELLCFLGQN
jgi:phosphoglycolate phosphatase